MQTNVGLVYLVNVGMNDDLEAGRIISHCVLGPQDLINCAHESMIPTKVPELKLHC